MSPYDAATDLHDSYYAAVAELRRRHVADTLRLEHGDCLEVIPRLVAEGVTVDAIVTDPPYGLEFMGVAWDSFAEPKGGPRQRNEWGDFGSREHARDQAGAARVALNRASSLQVFTEAWARAAYTILRPGGYLVAFGGTRTYHRLVCAIEDAGFVIQDQIAWLYGSGFPKHRSHLKPAHEPICLAYKLGGKRTMQVDECRVGATKNVPASVSGRAPGVCYGRFAEYGETVGVGGHDPNLGRWPANVVHDGSAEVLAAFPAGGAPKLARSGIKGGDNACFMSRGDGTNATRMGFWPADEGGSAARFFYAAKADAGDRWGSRHPTVKPIDLIRWLVTLTVPPGGIFLDPFAGSGTAAVAAIAAGRNAILIEREAAYVADIRERIAHYEGEGRHSLAAKGRGRTEATGTLL